MDENLGNLHLLGDLEQGEKVSDVGVNTTVRDQTAQVQTPIALLSTSEGLGNVVNLVHLALLEGLVNANTVLPDNTAGTNVQVTDLTVAHQALGQTDSERRGIQLGEALGGLGVGLGEARHERGLGGGDGITLGWGVGARDTPAINDNCMTLVFDLGTWGDSRSYSKQLSGRPKPWWGCMCLNHL